MPLLSSLRNFSRGQRNPIYDKLSERDEGEAEEVTNLLEDLESFDIGSFRGDNFSDPILQRICLCQGPFVS